MHVSGMKAQGLDAFGHPARKVPDHRTPQESMKADLSLFPPSRTPGSSYQTIALSDASAIT